MLCPGERWTVDSTRASSSIRGSGLAQHLLCKIVNGAWSGDVYSRRIGRLRGKRPANPVEQS